MNVKKRKITIVILPNCLFLPLSELLAFTNEKNFRTGINSQHIS